MTCMTIRPTRSRWNELDRLFEDIWGVPVMRTPGDTDFSPRVNIEETKDHLVVTFELPGMEKKDIKVQVKDSMLTVSGKRELKSEEKDTNTVRSEIWAGSFSRSFTLPETIDPEKIAADYKNGLLEIRMDKLEEVKPKEIEIKVS
jgi:HSP20 family protein